MTERRRYTRKDRTKAAALAANKSVTAVAEEMGVPRTTIAYWLERPEFVELRRKTAAEMAEGSMVLAKLAQAELVRRIEDHEVEPKDLAVILGIAIDKAQLLDGKATSRTETVTAGFDDHEKAALHDLLAKALEEASA